MEPQVARITLPGLQETIRTELDGAFAELGRIIAADYAVIDEVNQYLLGIRGKMFRPTLLLLASRAAGGPRPDDTTLAAVVELIHLATLIHDDSVDHSVLRRGQPTVNALFSHEVAVIMGDYLYSRAIIELVNIEDREPLRVMSRVTNDMTVGEMRELEAHDELDFSEQRYLRMIEAKTASLMAGACEVGAIPGGAVYREPLRQYGHQLGLAFQIVDDLLDYTSTEDVTGKPAGLDLREHKVTLPLIAALPEMDRDERALAEALMADPTPSDDVIATVIDVVERRGGTEVARARAQEFGRRADEALDRVPASRERDVLRDCVTYAVERQS